MKRILFLATVLTGGIACTNSGLGDVSNTDTSLQPTAGTTAGGNACAWVGTWQVSQSWCGGIDITTDWETKYDTTRMVVSDDGSGSGDCDVAFTLIGSACTEKESWSILYSTDDSTMSFQFGGIDSCDPEGCEFGFDDPDPCLVGDHTFADTIDLDLDNSMGDGLLRITGLLQSNIPECPAANAVTTQWVRN